MWPRLMGISLLYVVPYKVMINTKIIDGNIKIIGILLVIRRIDRLDNLMVFE